MKPAPFVAWALAAWLAAAGAGCRSVYYATWEKLGKHKRDLLRDQVKEAQQDQKAASEQFKDALTQIKELYGFEGGELEKTYQGLKTQYDRCTAKAEAVKTRVNRVETIAEDLFKEWETELQIITNPRLRSDSSAKLQETRRRFESLHSAMKRAEQSMEPVLVQFRDQVTYLKHNLNAQAISALKGEAVDIEREIQQLLVDMNRSIAEADRFINTLP